MTRLQQAEVSHAMETSRRDVLEEAVQIVRRMLTEERTTFSGKHFQIPIPGIPDRGSTVQDLTLVPKPIAPIEVWQAVVGGMGTWLLTAVGASVVLLLRQPPRRPRHVAPPRPRGVLMLEVLDLRRDVPAASRAHPPGGRSRLGIDAPRGQHRAAPGVDRLVDGGRVIEVDTDGVFFVPLAPLSMPDAIVTAIADSVGFSFYGGDTPTQQLITYLSEQQTLLLLDNFEHLLDAAPFLSRIVDDCPRVKLLVTSRRVVKLRSARTSRRCDRESTQM